MNIVFVAGGFGTRFKELSVFPKILLPTASYDSLLTESISRFSTDNDFYIVINAKFYEMVQNYVKVNHLKELLGLNSLTIIETNIANGSLSTLADVQYMLPSDDCLFVWSDIIPPLNDYNIENHIDTIKYNAYTNFNGIIFTSDEGQYRYKFDGFSIDERLEYDGNIPGIYYFKKNPDFKNAYLTLIDKPNCDLVDYIQYDIKENGATYIKDDIKGIVEYKDLETYKKLLKDHKVNLSQTRFFNKISVNKEKRIVTKQAINSDYYEIIRDEMNWYKDINLKIGNGIISPKIYMYDMDKMSFIMEYLDGYIQLHVFNDKADKDNIIKAYDGIKNNIDALSAHTINVDKETFIKDLEKEMKTKVIDRCDKISHMLINYDKEYLTSLLDKVMDSILDLYKDSDKVTYTLCHGDLNGSNVMVNADHPEKVKFIDPRGYFGFTKMYGWDVYEYSKLLYGLMGYDDFNLNPQIYLSDEPKNHKYKNLIEYLNKPIYKLVVGVIYVALAGYISQDIMKANIAYEYGIKLINQYYEQEKSTI